MSVKSVAKMTPRLTQGPSDMDIALGESASACNFPLTKEHISNLRVMVATRDKLKRFLYTSAEEDHEVPRKQIKIDTENNEDNEATRHANEDGNRCEFQVIMYTEFFSIILCLSLSNIDHFINQNLFSF